MEKLSKIPLLGLPYLIFSGCLYHIAFWSKFNINGLAYIDVSSIIVSSLYPILSLGGFYILLELIAGKKIDIEEESITSGCFLYVLFVLIVIMAFYFYDKCKLYDWFLWGLGIGSFLALFLYGEGLLKEQVQNSVQRFKLLQALCLGMSFSFCSGKYESDKIYLNQEYRYTIVEPNTLTSKLDQNARMKYLGTLGEKYFFTDSTNSNIFIYNNIDAIQLFFYKKVVLSKKTEENKK